MPNARPAWPFSQYTLALVPSLAHAPAANFYLDQAAPVLIALFYVALFGLTWLLSRPPGRERAGGA